MNGMFPLYSLRLEATEALKDAILSLSFIEELEDVSLESLYELAFYDLTHNTPTYPRFTYALRDMVMGAFGNLCIRRCVITVLGVLDLSPLVCIWSTANAFVPIAGLPAYAKQHEIGSWWRPPVI